MESDLYYRGHAISITRYRIVRSSRNGERVGGRGMIELGGYDIDWVTVCGDLQQVPYRLTGRRRGQSTEWVSVVSTHSMPRTRPNTGQTVTLWAPGLYT